MIGEIISDLTTSTEFNVGYRNGYDAATANACRAFCDQCNHKYAFVHAKDCSLNRATCEKLNTFRKAVAEQI